jgi:two-component system, NtrC family, response regulator AtoC
MLIGSSQIAADAVNIAPPGYVTNRADPARVRMAPGNRARVLEMKSEQGPVRGEPCRMSRFGPLIGASPPMQRLYDLIGRVAPTDAGVLIAGETGTGKEVVAQTIHSLSRRGTEAFLPVNCGAVSATLIESELFGHERGSFTGADRLHKGYFERAHRGTLFLDEVTEMPSDLQVRLLRVLDTCAVVRVGGTETIKVDVRIIAATNRQPQEAVAAGRLRQDLLYRLNVFSIPLPPLRERGDDIFLLAEQFLGELNEAEGTTKTFTAAGLERLRRHPWPGNVRELRHAVQRAFILAEKDVDVDCLPLPSHGSAGRVTSLPAGEGGASSLMVQLGTSLADAQHRLLLATLDHFGGDKPRAARVLGISLKTMYSRTRELNASR